MPGTRSGTTLVLIGLIVADHCRADLLRRCCLVSLFSGVSTFLTTTAATAAAADVVRSLLEVGADTTAKMTGGWTALSAACAGGHDLTAKHLLRAGADPNEQDDLGRTLLHDAAEDCRWDVVRYTHTRKHGRRNVMLRQHQCCCLMEVVLVRRQVHTHASTGERRDDAATTMRVV